MSRHFETLTQVLTAYEDGLLADSEALSIAVEIEERDNNPRRDLLGVMAAVSLSVQKKEETGWVPPSFVKSRS